MSGMQRIFSGPLGIVHTAAAIVAVVVGTIVLRNRKGTRFHRRMGYLYVVAMLAMNATALGIYRLFNGFGLFHYMALASLFAIAGGMYPAIFRRHDPDWYVQHLEVMGWSVVGLYAALAAEISVRLVPPRLFFWAVGLSGGVITLVGARLIRATKARAKAHGGVPGSAPEMPGHALHSALPDHHRGSVGVGARDLRRD